MGLSGLEPPTSRLSGVRSNRLSYKPNQNNLIFKSGSHLLSHTVSSIVSSAVWVLTIVFGMCTGVSPKRIATRKMSCGTQAIMELLRNSLYPTIQQSKTRLHKAVLDSSTERQSLLHILSNVAFFSLERR